MKNSIYTFIAILVMLLNTACSKEIEVDTGEFQHKHVIEGYIENGENPWVVVTNNMQFFSSFNLDFTSMEGLKTLSEMFVTNAEVIVSDGVIYDTLELVYDTEIFSGKPVWPPLRYTTSNLVGEVGKTYTLQVNVDNQMYTSQTTITEPYVLDTLWAVYDKNEPDYYWLHTMIHDDVNEANFYNCYSKRLGIDNDFAECFMCLWDDKFFNGQTFEAVLYRGSQSTLLQSNDTIDTLRVYGKFHVDDTVALKVLTMDNNSFNFWISLQGSTVVNSNIEGGALGVWCGYGVSYTEPRSYPKKE